MKEETLRLAETMEMYDTLRNMGILMDPDLDDFRRDCNAFVREGTPSSAKPYVRSADRVLVYDLKVKDGAPSRAVLKKRG